MNNVPEDISSNNQLKTRQRVTDHGEVFTSEREVNAMLDLVKQETERIDSRFLEPACGTGNFLVEILKRKLAVVENRYSKNQLEYERYSILALSSIYGVEILKDNVQTCRDRLLGIFTHYYLNNYKKEIKPEFLKAAEFILGRNILWGDALSLKTPDEKAEPIIFSEWSAEVYDRGESLETYAYNFIHTEKPEEIYKMKFDVIVGNPPYQLSDGGDNSEDARTRGGAIPLYHKFVQQAKKLNPRFLIMIIPSRWFSGGRGLDDFRDEMLNDERIRKIIDYPVSSECFPGVEIKGGVCYFLWDRENQGNCEVKTIRGDKVSSMIRPLLEKNSDIFVRYNEAISILRKVLSKNEDSFSEQVSAQKPFGLRTFFKGKSILFKGSIKLYANKSIGYVKEEEITQNKNWIDKHKVYTTMAYGAGEDFPHQILNKPFYGEPNSCCTETYIVIGPYSSKKKAHNVLSYIQTRFFRFLVLLRKNTQHASKSVYSFVPIQNFDEPWTDEKLYKKYGITKDEIAFIESMVRPMELNDEQ